MTAPLLRDVTLRDGLQLTGKALGTEHKVRLAKQLLAVGVPELEIGSMARPDLVPPMANTLEVIAGLSPEDLERCWVWVATPRHVQRAAEAGARNFQYCFSVSDAHNRKNIGRDAEDSLAAMPEAIRFAREAGGRIQLSLATSFSCPFTGPVPMSRVLQIVRDSRTEGADDVVIADTLGQAIPRQVAELIEAVRDESPTRRIVFHGHDTWGLGVANSLAAVAAGAAVVDGSLGGLGGCPFAPGASGNTSSEEILFATQPSWFTPPVLHEMLGATTELLAQLGEPNRSKTVEGACSPTQAFPWAMPAPGTQS